MTEIIAQSIAPADPSIPGAAELIDRARANHRRHCSRCSCSESILVEEIVEVVATADADGRPLGLLTILRPAIYAHYRKKKTP